MKRGEIWWVRLPPADGHEQAGERPAIILTEDTYIATLPMVFVVPLTSAMHAARFPGTLIIQPDSRNGLTRPSVALIFQMRALDKRRLIRRMGELEAATLAQIWTILDSLLGR